MKSVLRTYLKDSIMRIAKFILTLSAYLIFSQTSAQENLDFPPPENPPVVIAIKAEGKITIDGKLNEIDWDKVAPTTDFYRREPRQGGNANVVVHRDPVAFGVQDAVGVDGA